MAAMRVIQVIWRQLLTPVGHDMEQLAAGQMVHHLIERQIGQPNPCQSSILDRLQGIEHQRTIKPGMDGEKPVFM